MRTTVEITDAQRMRLHELAARRGQRGLSRLVREAIDLYLEAQGDVVTPERVRAALAILGTLDGRSADALEASARAIRTSWRRSSRGSARRPRTRS